MASPIGSGELAQADDLDPGHPAALHDQPVHRGVVDDLDALFQRFLQFTRYYVQDVSGVGIRARQARGGHQDHAFAPARFAIRQRSTAVLPPP